MWLLLLVPAAYIATAAVIGWYHRYERAETDRQVTAWARQASADQLFSALRPSLAALVDTPAHGVVAPLLAVAHWTDRELHTALQQLVQAMRDHGFCTGDIRAWQNSWYFESRYREIVGALEARSAS